MRLGLRSGLVLVLGFRLRVRLPLKHKRGMNGSVLGANPALNRTPTKRDPGPGPDPDPDPDPDPNPNPNPNFDPSFSAL